VKTTVFIGTSVDALPHDIALEHVATRQYASGLAQSEYEVAV
jgi:hypothetical protein